MPQESPAEPEPTADDPRPRRKKRRRSAGPRIRIRLAHALLGLVIILPPLWIGGVPPIVVPIVLALVLALVVMLGLISRDEVQIPRAAVLGAVAVAITVLQWVPIPETLRVALAPELGALVERALEGTDVARWPGLSPTPADTALEVGRLVALTVLFVAAARMRWRVCAAFVALAGSIVAAAAFIHAALDLNAIYGLYESELVNLRNRGGMFGTFVNPNHQGGLLLLSVFATAALAVDQQDRAASETDPEKAGRAIDRSIAAVAMLLLQVPALVLTLSRGALAVAIAVAPIAVLVSISGRARSEGRRARSRRRSSILRIAIAGMLLALFVFMAQHGAWQELATLTDPDTLAGEVAWKLRVAEESLPLISLSPVLGAGRGAFIDLFPAIDSQAGQILYTHVESEPIQALVEWGPVVGTGLIVGIAWWWVASFRRARRRSDGAPRRLALMGLLAVLLHNLVDYNLSFLGVAAPACALAGSLGLHRAIAWSPRRFGALVVPALLASLVLASISLPHAWQRRWRVDDGILAGQPPESALRNRPLDGRLHAIVSRVEAERGEWQKARTRATVATELRPGGIEGWLLASAAARALGDPADADSSMRSALERLQERPGQAFVDHLLAAYPVPEDLVAVAPERAWAWGLLVDSLTGRAPDHVDALAEARIRRVGDEGISLKARSNVALARENPSLALHYARLWRAEQPENGLAHIAVAAAYRAFDPPRRADARDALELGLTRTRIYLGDLEEDLVETLIALGGHDALVRADEVMSRLLLRSARRKDLRRRRALARRLGGLLEEAKDR